MLPSRTVSRYMLQTPCVSVCIHISNISIHMRLGYWLPQGMKVQYTLTLVSLTISPGENT